VACSVLEELPVRDHARILPALHLVLDVLVPEVVLVVVVVAWQDWVVLQGLCCFDVVDACVWFDLKVSHHILDS
jgi:hypothetical protein